MALPFKNLATSKVPIVNFNWMSNLPPRSIEDTIVVNYENDEELTDEDINEIIDVNRTVDFSPQENCSNKPALTFISSTATDNFFISRLYVVCDCRIIEVFGDHDIYLDTVHGSVVEESGEFRALEFRLDLSNKVHKQITINFHKLNSSNRLWIYGLQLTLKTLTPRNNLGSIKYENVEELMKGSPISEKAAKCFNFVKEFAANSHYNSGQKPFLQPFAGMCQDSNNNNEKLLKEMKLYIDHKFQVLTEFLILRERNLHDKIDLILDYVKTHPNRNV